MEARPERAAEVKAYLSVSYILNYYRTLCVIESYAR